MEWFHKLMCYVNTWGYSEVSISYGVHGQISTRLEGAAIHLLLARWEANYMYHHLSDGADQDLYADARYW